MPTAVEDVVQAAASGVLRALDARKAGQEVADTVELVRAGFVVSVVIRAGGIPGPISEQVALNPQPLPPGE
jgi:hypothetical protein